MLAGLKNVATLVPPTSRRKAPTHQFDSQIHHFPETSEFWTGIAEARWQKRAQQEPRETIEQTTIRFDERHQTAKLQLNQNLRMSQSSN
ncbi:MAG: hypothetical protein V7703_04075 [Hyphomicrobiales bacterium]